MKKMSVKSYNFNPLTSKSSFVIPSRDEYVVKQFTSVSVRLNYEYKECIDSNGLVYFVTFTYNDNGCIHFGNFNYFDNSHIRKFFNKSIFPSRLSDHGYTFRFALFGECGDGKGVRGIDNNPHYHVLVFLYPTKDCDFYYHSDTNFLDLCKSAWNQDLSCLDGVDYRALNIGNVSYSCKGAKVIDSSCFNYCASYCIKTLSISPYNQRVAQFMKYVAFASLFDLVYSLYWHSPFLLQYTYDMSKCQDIYRGFVSTYGNKLSILSPFRCKKDDYFECLQTAVQNSLLGLFPVSDYSYIDIFAVNKEFFETRLFTRIMELPLFDAFYKYIVNRHKCCYRMSPNLGSLGFKHIDKNYLLDVSFFPCFNTPKINLPSYYYRKLFFQPVKYLDKYVYVHTPAFNEYCKYRYSDSNFSSLIKSYESNLPFFLKSLDDDYRSACKDIPPHIFVAYKAFRGLSFSINYVPDLNYLLPWSYLRGLDYSESHLYSIPRGLDAFQDYISFSLHPLFINYPLLDDLTYMYDDFVSTNSSASKINDVSQYFKLSDINGKDFKVHQ